MGIIARARLTRGCGKKKGKQKKLTSLHLSQAQQGEFFEVTLSWCLLSTIGLTPLQTHYNHSAEVSRVKAQETDRAQQQPIQERTARVLKAQITSHIMGGLYQQGTQHSHYAKVCVL